MTLECTPRVELDHFREQRAREKAEGLMALLQGTSALEDQALDSKTLNRMKRQTIHELLAGSPSKLWSD
jgi:hypothetical protein